MPLALGSFGPTFTDGPGTDFASVTITSGDVPAGASDDQILFIVHAVGRTVLGVGRTDSLTQLTTISFSPSGDNRTHVARVYQVERSAWDGSTTFSAAGSTPVPPRTWIQVTPFVITGGVTGWQATFTDGSTTASASTLSNDAWTPPAGHSFAPAEGLVVTLGIFGGSASLSSAQGFGVDLNRDTTATVGGGMTDRWLAVASRYQPIPAATTLTAPTWSAPSLVGGAFLGLTFAAYGDAPDPPGGGVGIYTDGTIHLS